MKLIAVIAPLLALASCVHPPTARSFLSPEGKQAYLINCGDAGMAACHDKAREACRGNYAVARTVDETVPVTNPGTGQLVSLPRQRLEVVCSQ